MLYITGIIITFFLAAILVTKKNKSEADWILAVWLIVIGIHLVFYYLFYTNQITAFPWLLGFEAPFPLLHGPLLFLYTASLTQQLNNRKNSLLHFAPVMAVYIYLSRFILSPANEKVWVYDHKGAGYEAYMNFMNMAIILSGVSYIALSWQKLERHRKNIAAQFSSIDKINLTWLRNLIICLSLIWVAVILGNDLYIHAFAVLMVLYIGYFGIKQVGIFTHQLPFENTPVPALADIAAVPAGLTDDLKGEKSKYLKSGLNESAAENILLQLQRVMDQEKLYTNPELTLADLSRHLEVHPNNLSQVINSMTGKNFYDYINDQRVDAFKKAVALPDNQRFTLLALAYECGFNSKTSFNRNFKKATGLSPTEYLNQVEIRLS